MTYQLAGVHLIRINLISWVFDTGVTTRWNHEVLKQYLTLTLFLNYTDHNLHYELTYFVVSLYRWIVVQLSIRSFQGFIYGYAFGSPKSSDPYWETKLESTCRNHTTTTRKKSAAVITLRWPCVAVISTRQWRANVPPASIVFISWWTVTAYVYNTVYSELMACNPTHSVTAAPLQTKPLMRHGAMTTSATCL